MVYNWPQNYEVINISTLRDPLVLVWLNKVQSSLIEFATLNSLLPHPNCKDPNGILSYISVSKSPVGCTLCNPESVSTFSFGAMTPWGQFVYTGSMLLQCITKPISYMAMTSSSPLAMEEGSNCSIPSITFTIFHFIKT